MKNLVLAGKETGLEVIVNKTKYMVMFRDKNAGRNHSIKTANSCFERVEQFRYLGTTLININSTQKEISSNMKLENASCHLVQNILYSNLI